MSARSEINLVEAHTPARVPLVRALFEEYAAWLGQDLCFQGYAAELARLPGDYAPPRGALLLAEVGGATAGCVALRSFDGDTCEMKRLYVRGGFRGRGVGRALAVAVIERARDIGYARMCLDTLATEQLAAANRLYESLGFHDIPSYYGNPIPTARYMALDLT